MIWVERACFRGGKDGEAKCLQNCQECSVERIFEVVAEGKAVGMGWPSPGWGRISSFFGILEV